MITYHAASRLVTVDVVARDHRGQPAVGLTAKDFEVFDQESGFRKEKKLQKVAAFRALGMAGAATQVEAPLEVAAGMYTNLVTVQKSPVPPTMILVDGLNTDISAQMQVHSQMLRMLKSLPDDVPVAVFLLGRHLRMLQSFTTDPKLLKAALQKASTIEAGGVLQTDPRDDPDSLSAFNEKLTAVSPESLIRFEQERYAFNLDMRVRETVDAVRSIALHVAGYPGRKNLLWLSSSFPIAINPDVDAYRSFHDYGAELAALTNTLGEAKVSVYPIDLGAGQTTVMQTRRQSRGPFGGSSADAITRGSQMQTNRQATMEILAGDTGGQICTDINDLSYCVKKAVSDSSAFYEISYTPDTSGWHGEFHRIIVKTSQPGLHLAYRQGYFARPDGSETSDLKTAGEHIQQAACDDFLTATSVTLAVRVMRSDSPQTAKYWVLVDPDTVSFPSSADGGRELNLMIAACTFDKAGKPVKLFRDPIQRKLSAKEYKILMTQNFVPHDLLVSGGLDIAMVRVLVEDMTTARVGSVNIPYDALPAAATGNAQAPTPH